MLTFGLSSREIELRTETGRLHRLHPGVYALGHEKLSLRSHWMAAVLLLGPEAVLSHRSTAALWGLMRPRGSSIEVSSGRARRRSGIVVHQSSVDPADRTIRDGIPVTTVARTLFDLAEVDERRFEAAFEEADRLRLLEMRALEDVCARSPGRHALGRVRGLMDAAREPPRVRSPLEERFAALCHARGLPAPVANVTVLGCEVDALWPGARLIVELDGFAYHRHRAAFERDRIRDARLQAAGYRVIRLTHRRLESDPEAVASEIRSLLSAASEEQSP